MDPEVQNTAVFHNFQQIHKANAGKAIIFLIILILLGIGGGFLMSKVASHPQNGAVAGSSTGNTQVVKGTIYGSNDTKTFKDSATGTLQLGGIDGEGQYHLVRPGGDSQNVYMTSSSVDLSQFVNHKVTVWGETQAAQHAGWLMDVGRVEVLQ